MTTTDSAAAFYAEGILDVDRWFQIADADYWALLTALDINVLFPASAKHLRLLDIGCGTGRFPTLLRPHLNQRGPVIEYDFIDPSPYCLTIMRESLAEPFNAGQGLQMGVEDLDAWGRESGAAYDIVWAIHSLYYGATDDTIPAIMRSLRGLLAPETGVGLIYIATRNSFYLNLHDSYRKLFPCPLPPFLTAEDYAAAFAAANLPWQEQRLRFFHEVPVNEDALLESYLHKCVLDPSRPLTEWRNQAPLREMIEGYRDGEVYRFPQEVALFRFGA